MPVTPRDRVCKCGHEEGFHLVNARDEKRPRGACQYAPPNMQPLARAFAGCDCTTFRPIGRGRRTVRVLVPPLQHVPVPVTSGMLPPATSVGPAIGPALERLARAARELGAAATELERVALATVGKGAPASSSTDTTKNGEGAFVRAWAKTAHEAGYAPGLLTTRPALAAGDTRPPVVTTIKAGARRMLEVLERYHPRALTRHELAMLAGMQVRGGTFGAYLGALKARVGVVDDGRVIRLASSDQDSARPLRLVDVLERWRPRLKAGARRMFDELVRVYPDKLARGELAARVGMEPRGGTFGAYVSALRSAGLIHETPGGRDLSVVPLLFAGEGS